jgi:hypothetical protein
MVGLKKYIEWLSRSRRTNRIAYVVKEWDLPMPFPGAEWHIDQNFSVADELLNDPDLKTVFKAALEKGGRNYHSASVGEDPRQSPGWMPRSASGASFQFPDSAEGGI